MKTNPLKFKTPSKHPPKKIKIPRREVVHHLSKQHGRGRGRKDAVHRV